MPRAEAAVEAQGVNVPHTSELAVIRALLRTAAVLGSAGLVLSAPSASFAAGAPHAHKPHAKHVAKKPVPFAAVGKVVAVDAEARTLTVAVDGGSRDLHGKSVVVTLVSTTKVTVDDAAGSLDLVDVGDTATANGRRVGTTLQAAHLNVTSAPIVPTPEQPAV